LCEEQAEAADSVVLIEVHTGLLDTSETLRGAPEPGHLDGEELQGDQVVTHSVAARAFRASVGSTVGSTDARKSRARCFGVVGPTRASVDSTPTNPHVGTSKSQEGFRW
jgi:hypothetical protein